MVIKSGALFGQFVFTGAHPFGGACCDPTGPAISTLGPTIFAGHGRPQRFTRRSCYCHLHTVQNHRGPRPLRHIQPTGQSNNRQAVATQWGKTASHQQQKAVITQSTPLPTPTRMNLLPTTGKTCQVRPPPRVTWPKTCQGQSQQEEWCPQARTEACPPPPAHDRSCRDEEDKSRDLLPRVRSNHFKGWQTKEVH